MENVNGINAETELRKRSLKQSLFKPRTQNDSIKVVCEDPKRFLKPQSMTTNTSTVINEYARETKGTNSTREMTMPSVSSLINSTTKARIKTKTSTRETSPVKKTSTFMIKRSLSESSAEEYCRRSETTLENSSNTRKMWHNELIVSPNSDDIQPKRRGRSNDRAGNTSKQKNKKHAISDMIDVGIRTVVVILFIKLETTPAFHRNIHVEELWLYKNPRTPDYVTPAQLILSVIICPFIATLLFLFLTRDRRDFRAANWSWTLSLCLNGLSTSLLKITTGRPRPDFFYRCFPDGQLIANFTPTAINFDCTGNWRDINEGYKSFPSGHSSFAFASFGFIAFYLAGKLHAFNNAGRGESWRLFATVWPLFIAALIAVSRTCDYHHHWQDVLVGALIGILVSYLTYRQYYPSIFSPNSHRPFPRDGRYNVSHHHSHSQNKYRHINEPTSDAVHVNRVTGRKDKCLVSEDQMPLIFDEDDVE